MLELKRLFLTLATLLAISICVFSQESVNRRSLDIQSLIADLHNHPWSGGEIIGESPTMWNFAFTEPMLRILEIGSPAQEVLLAKIDDAQIKDQVIILLGGIGDERAVAPIVNAMVTESDMRNVPNAQRINQSANIALTNITVADVIWHHGGGIVIERCPTNPKECWLSWWRRNEATFSVRTIAQSRRYSNYPNYGIYRQQ